MKKDVSLKNLQTIPGVGRAVSQDLYNLGYRKVEDLKSENPQKMYDKLCKLQGMKVDRCMLYTFRCVVYFASTNKHDLKLLKWWNWMDKN